MPQPTAIIGSRTNPRVKQLRAAFHGNPRLAGGLIAVEGETLIREALRSGLELESIFLSGSRDIPPWLPPTVEIIVLAETVFASAADTQTPKGIAALLRPPAWEFEGILDQLPADALILIAAGLQDPGNLGTLIRSAEAFGASAILTTPGTVSPWNQKALRASAGSVFRLPLATVEPTHLAALVARGVLIMAAVTGDSAPHFSSAVPVHQLDLTRACAVMIGHEGGGLPHDLVALAGTRITIPTPGPVESLNAAVAGSLLLYEACRQRLLSPKS